MAAYVGVLVSNPWLQHQFTQFGFLQFIAMRRGSDEAGGPAGEDPEQPWVDGRFSEPSWRHSRTGGGVDRPHLGPSLHHEKVAFLHDSNHNPDVDVDFELFWRVYLKHQALVTEKRGIGAKNASAFLKSPTSTLFHTISESEKASYVAHINNYLAKDEFLKKYLPLDSATNDLFEIVKDGVLICNLINVGVPRTIDEQACHASTF
ncbi:fimbrin-2-like [Salvia divinorum]|uniref:Fimbrin-2-like n=1 Tax=Salvia divinorum TaxID=28513 RepID=A0ABD1FMH3_SALDI